MLVDTDIHPLIDPERIVACLAEPWRSRYASGSHGPGSVGYWNPNGVRRADAVLEDGSEIASDPTELVDRFLRPYGIDYGVLNPDRLDFALSPEPAFAAAVAAAVNTVVAQDWLGPSRQLIGSILVSPRDPQAAGEEIRRAGAHPQMVQVLLPSASPMPYGNAFFHPIYEAAHDMNLPIGIHPGLEGMGVSGPPTPVGYPGSYLEFHTGLVESYIAHLLSLVCEGVFTRFPTLKVVLIEGGVSWIPPILWRFDKNWKALRQTVPWLTSRPSEVVARHILLTTQPAEEPDDSAHGRQVLGMFDSQAMLMFSSDFPHWDGDTPDFAGRHLPTAIRPDVMGGNASRLYGLRPREGPRGE